MYRGLILGAIAFIAAFAAQRQLGAVAKDIDRYNKIRAMSGDSPVLQQGLQLLLALIKAYGRSRRGDGMGLLKSLQYDAIRYARISTM